MDHPAALGGFEALGDGLQRGGLVISKLLLGLEGADCVWYLAQSIWLFSRS
ncbi:MAG: hypothetical protein R3D67_22065 [Hyphomicrobiaceae bacterium]